MKKIVDCKKIKKYWCVFYCWTTPIWMLENEHPFCKRYLPHVYIYIYICKGIYIFIPLQKWSMGRET